MMALLKTELEKLQLSLKEHRDNLRFYQSRILKYESLFYPHNPMRIILLLFLRLFRVENGIICCEEKYSNV